MINILIFIIMVGSSSILLKRHLKKDYTQPLLGVGPDHKEKIGTKTMGGFAFLMPFFVFLILYITYFIVLKSYTNVEIIIGISIVLLGFFFIGYKDDILKIKNKKNESGLTPKQKLMTQLVVSMALCIILIHLGIKTDIQVVSLNLNLSILYYPLIVFSLVGFSNGTNLTDGLDGLLVSNVIVNLIFLNIIAYTMDNIFLVYMNTALLGCLVAFIYFNKNPAKIFMGDTGSLTLGVYIVLNCIILKKEFLLLFIGFIYIIEVLSVMMQVIYFKYTKKKYNNPKRLFLMAPLHHHYEKKGLSENKIVLMFVTINIVMSIIGLCFI